jgi:hypothetical protein
MCRRRNNFFVPAMEQMVWTPQASRAAISWEIPGLSLFGLS